jgi:hypothetical protein
MTLNGIYRYKKNQPLVWFHRSKAKSNQFCFYCGRFVGVNSSLESNKEHLIGREFVPTGEFGDGELFNFIFRACKECNDEKSDVERHISSITLLNSPSREVSEAHNRIAIRKAEKDYHPDKQGVLIRNSGEQLKINGDFGPAQISFGMFSPPQANSSDVKFLAFRHIQGIFSFVTSPDPLTAKGTSLLDWQYFYLYESYRHQDWGNPQLIEIMQRALCIPCCADIKTANGFFKVILRKEEESTGEWFWALEWNKSHRIVGAISSSGKMPKIFEGLPRLIWDRVDKFTRVRKEVPLQAGQDLLF